jgi:hypothetical protein
MQEFKKCKSSNGLRKFALIEKEHAISSQLLHLLSKKLAFNKLGEMQPKFLFFVENYFKKGGCNQ